MKRTMTRKQAKEITLEVWEYSRDHPEIECKSDLPDEIRDKIYFLRCECPLCELYYNKNCPLYVKGTKPRHCNLYSQWIVSFTNRDRRISASVIVELVKKWRV